MKESTLKKLDKKLAKLHDKFQKLIDELEDIHVTVIAACEKNEASKEEKPVAKKRGKKK